MNSSFITLRPGFYPSVCLYMCIYVSYISNKPPLVGEHDFPLTEFVARRLTLHLNGINQVNYVLHSVILL